MAKMTKAQLASFVQSYVAANKIAGTWTSDVNTFTKMVEKIGKQITIDGDYSDKLPELTGDELPLGKTIEEYFIDLIMPTDKGDRDEDDIEYPVFENCAYSYDLGNKTISTFVPFNQIESACNDAVTAGNVATKTLDRLTNSESIYNYQVKKELLGKFATAAATKASLKDEMAIPTDTASGEAFIQRVKELVEDASFASEGNSVGNALIGAAPSLTLYVKKGVMPAVQVQTLAGAFNKEDLAIPARVKVVDDFGSNEDAWAMLVDDRGVKLHSGYRAVRSKEMIEEDGIKYVLHTRKTAFYSKNTYVHVFKA